MSLNSTRKNQPAISFSSIETQRQLRIERMNKLKALGHDPFTPDSHRDFTLAKVKEDFDLFRSHSSVTLAGRLKTKRTSGKIAFGVIEDESLPSGFQFIFKKDVLSPEIEASETVNESTSDSSTEANKAEIKHRPLNFEDYKTFIDEGDYIQATGYLDYSQSGEASLFVNSYEILTKALRPLPEELDDIEKIYRQRYIDMRLHPEVREMFKQKSRFWSATRKFMQDNGFDELTMPTMEETTGGAEATPFVTHHNALDQDFYLRISSELHQKRMIVGGFEKIYDIDKNFRNEGIDDEHLQEYTQLEFYWAYANYSNLIEFTEKLIKYVIQETFGGLTLEYQGQEIDWSKNWPQVPYYDFVEQYAGIKLADYDTLEKLRELASDLGLKYEESDGKGRLIDLIYKKTARPKCIQPVWLIDLPVEISPLSKRKPEKPSLTQRVQLIAYGSELTNGFSELNDPIDQLERFEEQQRLREDGDDEAMMLDHDFVTALEIGMPPTAGFAYSERLFTVLLQKPIREATPFPLLRSEQVTDKKSQKTMVAHMVTLDTPEIENWRKLNAVAHLSAAFGARLGTKLIWQNESDSQDGESILMNIQHAIINKKTDSSDKILELKHAAEKAGLDISVFTQDMQNSSDDSKVTLAHSKQTAQEIKWLGVLIFGKKSDVELLTEGFERVT